MRGGLTTEELIASNPMRAYLSDVLRDEQRSGRIERAADGTWMASAALVARYGRAFGDLTSLTGSMSTPTRGERL